MKEISFTVFGDPIIQKRARFSRIGKFVKTYDPSAEDKRDFASVAKTYAPEEIISTPVVLEVICYFKRVKSHYRTGKYSDQLKPNAPTLHTKKPDGDNVLKGVGDALTGLFFKDDCIIWKMSIEKYYDEEPRTEIQIQY